MVSGARRLGFKTQSSWRDLAYALSFFVAYFALDLSTRRLTRLTVVDADGPSLLVDSVLANPVAAMVIVVPVAGLGRRSRSRLLCRWADLDRGSELRWLAAPLLVMLTWQGSLYDYNYLLDRAQLFDRSLLVVLAALALWRPAALLPFVIQTRAIAAQFAFPFATLAAQNVDELLVIALLAIAGAHVVYVITARADLSPVLLVIAAAVATHFFIPGKGKVSLNWLAREDLANLAGNGYTVGWLGQTDGGFARWLIGVFDAVNVPMRVATLVLELGAVFAAAHHRLLRVWLPLIVGFHVANFLLLGFWFLTWIALEVALLILLFRPDLRRWLDRNLSLARAGLTVVVIGLFGSTIFHPPGLAWYDTPLAYGYEIEVVGTSGAVYNLPIEAFAPFGQDLAFSRLRLGPTNRLTGAYGVVVSVDELNRLNRLTDVGQVAAMETPIGPADIEAHDRAERFLSDFVAHANRRASGENRLADFFDVVAPLPKYWTGRPGPVYRFQEPMQRLEVEQVASLRVGEHFQRQRTSVLVMNTG